MIAFADGKPVQFKRHSEIEWFDAKPEASNLEWLLQIYEYRPKPAPKTRPWNCPDDVPLNCWIRNPRFPKRPILITGIGENGISCSNREFDWADLSSNFEYSTDRKTWHKCEVTE